MSKMVTDVIYVWLPADDCDAVSVFGPRAPFGVNALAEFVAPFNFREASSEIDQSTSISQEPYSKQNCHHLSGTGLRFRCELKVATSFL